MMRCVCTAAFVLVCAQGIARAQQSGDKAAAEALFEEGRKLMTANDFASACPKFEASQRLDPGVGTMLNLADCYEKAGKTASAWAEFRETISAAHQAGSTEREKIARKRVQALEPKLSYLTIEPQPGQPVSVSRDGVAIDRAELGSAIPIDPGSHTIAASAPNKQSWSGDVNVGASGDRASIALPILQDSVATPPPMAAAPVPETSPAAIVAAAPSTPHRSGQRIGGIVAAAIGVAGIATGSVFGIIATSKLSDAKDHCDPYPHCGAEGQKLSKDAQRAGDISTVAFIVGGVGLVSGAILWFTAQRERRDSSLALDVGPTSLG
ncbi:MAG TPA: hypothetical protein VGI70_21750, partial [Polyangiales bacterium]